MNIQFLTSLVLLILISISGSVVAQQVVFVVRHADPPPMLVMDKLPTNTPISDAGKLRANRLANLLKDANIKAIYTSTALRTFQTAEPLSNLINIPIKRIPKKNIDILLDDIESNHAKDKVLIVSHWNYIPKILKALGQKNAAKFAKSEYGNLYIVVPQANQAPNVIRLHY
jgi:phosphohistidine phosphatase SixA